MNNNKKIKEFIEVTVEVQRHITPGIFIRIAVEKLYNGKKVAMSKLISRKKYSELYKLTFSTFDEMLIKVFSKRSMEQFNDKYEELLKC